VIKTAENRAEEDGLEHKTTAFVFQQEKGLLRKREQAEIWYMICSVLVRIKAWTVD
jgi:hypothetical protein